MEGEPIKADSTPHHWATCSFPVEIPHHHPAVGGSQWKSNESASTPSISIDSFERKDTLLGINSFIIVLLSFLPPFCTNTFKRPRWGPTTMVTTMTTIIGRKQSKKLDSIVGDYGVEEWKENGEYCRLLVPISYATVVRRKWAGLAFHSEEYDGKNILFDLRDKCRSSGYAGRVVIGEDFQQCDTIIRSILNVIELFVYVRQSTSLHLALRFWNRGGAIFTLKMEF